MTALAGTGPLVRLIVRRDRLRLSLWIAVLVVVTAGTAAALAKMFPTEDSRALFSTGVESSGALLAVVGPLFQPRTIGGLVAWRLGGIGAVLVALMSLLTVVRHTRAEESAGRRELVGSAAVGRHAALAAALLVTASTGVLIAALVTAGLAAMGLPLAGSLALGLSFAGAGWVFAAIAAVAAQLVENPRTASGIAVMTLGVAYLARAAGDAAQGRLSWLSWLSPIGWAQRVRPFAEEQWWTCGLAAGVAAALAVAAHALCARRDLGAGVLSPRPGRATASRWLAGAPGLAWRLQRGMLLTWTLGFAVIGGVLGGVAHSVPDLAHSSPRISAVLAVLGGDAEIVDAFFAALFGVLGVVASGYAVQATLRLRSEEEEARAEPVLAASVSRIGWAAGHLVFAAAGPAIALAAAGTTAAFVHCGDGDLPRLITAALVQLPAIWVLGGTAVALFGLAPRQARVSWGLIVGCLLVGQIGRLLQLPGWVLGLSPFTHLPGPGEAARAAPLLALVAVAAGLATAGLIGLRRRDLG